MRVLPSGKVGSYSRLRQQLHAHCSSSRRRLRKSMLRDDVCHSAEELQGEAHLAVPVCACAVIQFYHRFIEPGSILLCCPCYPTRTRPSEPAQGGTLDWAAEVSEVVDTIPHCRRPAAVDVRSASSAKHRNEDPAIPTACAGTEHTHLTRSRSETPLIRKQSAAHPTRNEIGWHSSKEYVSTAQRKRSSPKSSAISRGSSGLQDWCWPR